MLAHRRVLLFALCQVVAAGWSAADGGLVSSVAVSPAFFNPSLKQQVSVRFALGAPARVGVSVLDRDRVAVRRFPVASMRAGEAVVRWDGRDDAGGVVPNEAYSVRIEATGPGGTSVYDPSERFVPRIEEPAIRSYSRTEGVLSYTLERPSRVHIQAGQARPDARTGRMDGPILKTVVDREPRIAGAVVEVWKGMDESGTIFVPGLPHFAIAVLASSLPDNALIVAGGSGPGFAAYVRARRPAEALQPRQPGAAPAAHHGGLSGLEDRSPRLALRPRGVWDPVQRTWSVERAVRAQVAVAAEQAAAFLAQPQTLTVYLDEAAVLHLEHPRNPQEISLPGRLAAGEHRLVVNWASAFGPVGVAAARIVAQPASAALRRPR